MPAKQFPMYVPLELLQTPRTGECLVGYFWMVHPEKGALYLLDQRNIHRVDGVQEAANRDQRIVERFLVEGHEVVQVPVAYLAHGLAASMEFRRKVIEETRAGSG